MIATENQYRVTTRKLDGLRRSIAKLRKSTGLEPVFRRAQELSLSETAKELEQQIEEYNALRSGRVAEIPVDSLADLPKALIKARVARGVSQSDLASVIGVRPQQVQRWETEEYASAAFTALARVADALRLDMRRSVHLDDRPVPDPKELRRALIDSGLPASVIDARIMPRRVRASRVDMFLDEADARLRKLFGFGLRDALLRRGFEATALQFKLPGSANQGRTRAYAAYIDGLCAIVAKTVRRDPSPLPGSIEEMHARLFVDGVTLRGAVEVCWEMGIGVIALDDAVAFNGACRRRDGRAVIALKIARDEESRALFDLIHELYHLIATEGDFTLVELEETSPERRRSLEERRADRFAAEVSTNGRLGELLAEIAERSGGDANRLPDATLQVAKRAGVPVGLMANLFAGNLDRGSGRSWWASARQLQERGDPWRIVRDAFIRNAGFDRLDRVETDLVDQMLETSDDRARREA